MAAFTIAALVLGAFTLKNLSQTGSTFWTNPQTRLAQAQGNSHANINLKPILYHFQNLYSPRNHAGMGDTYYRRYKARIDAIMKTQ